MTQGGHKMSQDMLEGKAERGLDSRKREKEKYNKTGWRAIDDMTKERRDLMKQK